MKCPRCDLPLNLSQRQSVEIDVCPQCRGVWLDRGELDKITNRYDAYDREDERSNYDEHRHSDTPKRKEVWQEFFY